MLKTNGIPNVYGNDSRGQRIALDHAATYRVGRFILIPRVGAEPEVITAIASDLRRAAAANPRRARKARAITPAQGRAAQEKQGSLNLGDDSHRAAKDRLPPDKRRRVRVRITYRSEGGEILCTDTEPMTPAQASDLKRKLHGSDALRVEVINAAAFQASAYRRVTFPAYGYERMPDSRDDAAIAMIHAVASAA